MGHELDSAGPRMLAKVERILVAFGFVLVFETISTVHHNHSMTASITTAQYHASELCLATC